jgi:FkbH-like protein
MMITTWSFTQLLKNCKHDMSKLPSYRLALLGNCSTQHLAAALKGYAYTQNLSLELFDGDYNQIMSQIMDKKSEMYAFQPDSILIYMCTEKIYAVWCDTPLDKRLVFAETAFAEIQGYWDYITSNCNANILQFTFAEKDDYVFGNYACTRHESFLYQLRKLNLLLMDGCLKYKNVFLVDFCGIQARIGEARLHDPKLYCIVKMPISLIALPLVAANVINVIQSLRGLVKKCVILDLDNTLWGGAIGDDGLSGIQIGELGQGYAFSEFQIWLKELKKRGIILAVCSKNEEIIAKEPFEKHSEMVLRLDDFSAFIANWEDKATNIRHIQKTLNIGMDSIIFIDDNPFERNLVSSLIPEITVPDLPNDPAEYLSYLQSLNLFETASFSEEDANRTEQYLTEAKREALRQQYANFDEYLQSLDMIAAAAPFDEYHTPRIAQLTQRSNQFNLRTVRYTEKEIEKTANDPNYITLYFKLQDKFADHGLISVVILEKRDNKRLFINTWLMSCRVLKRSMEEFIINKIIETANQQGFETVIGEYIKTSKNVMVADIYEKLGFARKDESFFEADARNFQYNKSFVKERQP